MENLKTMKWRRRQEKIVSHKRRLVRASPKEIKKKSVATLITSEDKEKLTLLVKNINMYLEKERRSDPRRKGKKKAMKVTTWDSNNESEDDSARVSWSKGLTPLR